MKRVLSLVLALVIVFGTMPMAFAADQTAGEMLKAAGFVQGDENGNLMEDKGLTRAELAVLVAELNGVKENAKTYAIAPEFKDVKADEWFAPYVAYAAKEGWFKGDDEGNFMPMGTVSDQAMATVMLRALGYDPAWATAVSEAKAMGLPVGAADAATMTRGEAFSTMWGVVNTPKKDSDVALGVELGKLEPEAPVVEELVAEIDTASTKAMGNALVNVDFKASVDAAAAGQAANYTIVEKADTTKEIAVLSVDVFDGDDVFLETEGLSAGKAYTVMVGDSKGHFSGIAKDSDKPSLDSVKGTDTGEITVVFEDALVDRASAEDVANYTLEKEGTIVKAEVNSGLYEVTLTVEGMTSTKSQKLTVQNVMSTDGVVMSKEIKSFGPEYDKSAPKLDEVEASDHNNVEVLVTFDDDHGVDEATAEDVSNYSIDGLEIISAKATYINDNNDSYFDKVILTTEEQTKSKSYELEVKYMVDGSTAANATTKVLTEKFRGGTADSDEPKVKSVEERNLTEIEVIFVEENALDTATVLDAGNYEFDDNELEVVDVRFDDEDDNGNSYSFNVTGIEDEVAKDDDEIKVILTVTEMEEDESYKLRINNIADNFGNVMEDEETDTVKVSTEIESYYQIVDVTANDLEVIYVEFAGKVNEDSAEDATNYLLDGGIGAVKTATLQSDDTTVKLVVPELTVGKKYKVTVNNVENYWGYAAEDVVYSFIAANDAVDTTQPEVDDVDFVNKGELIVEFSEPVRATENDNGVSYVSVKTGTAAEVKLEVIDMRDDDKTLVFDASSDVTGISDDTEYDIMSFTGITDLAGNTVDYDEKDEDFSTDNDAWDQTDKDDAMRADGLSQESGNTVEVTFDGPIQLKTIGGAAIVETGNAGATVVYIPTDDDDSGSDADDMMAFTMEVIGDDDDAIRFTKTSSSFPDDSVELQFNFTRMSIGDDITTEDEEDDTEVAGDVEVLDLLGRSSYDEVNDIDVDNDDETEPVLEEVVVIDKVTIELHYSEKLKTTGSYEINYEDEDDDDEEKTISSSDIDVSFDDSDVADIVVLKLINGEELTDQDYDLAFRTSPKDLANNTVEDDEDTFSFVGVATDEAIDMVAAKVDGALNLTMINDYEDFADTADFEFSGTGSNDFDITATNDGATDEIDLVIKPFYALLEKYIDSNGNSKAVTYTFTYEADGTAGQSDYETQSFTGTLEEDKATKTASATGASTLAVQFTGDELDVDASNYVYYLVTAAHDDLDGAVELTVVDKSDMTFVDGLVTDGGADDTIAEAANGDIVVTGDGLNTEFKIVAVPATDGVGTGAIEVITQVLEY